MLYYILKVTISAILIVVVSEVSKRNEVVGGIFASVPLVSFLAIIWIYIEEKKVDSIIPLSKSIFWLVLPSLLFFLLFPVMLKYGWPFWLSMIAASAVMIVGYFITAQLLGL